MPKPTLTEIAQARRTLALAQDPPKKRTKRILAEEHVLNILDQEVSLPAAEDDGSYFVEIDGHRFHIYPGDDREPARLCLVTNAGKGTSDVERLVGSIEDFAAHIANDEEST